MKKSQKEAVVELVIAKLPGFVKYQDNAILMLSAQQLEDIKTEIYVGITNNTIEYSKDPNQFGEVRSYARSMVMNHLKKAKELNGGHSFAKPTGGQTVRVKEKHPSGVNLDLLPEDLKEYVKSLI